MFDRLAWNPDALAPVVGIGLTLICFLLYWFPSTDPSTGRRLESKYGERGRTLLWPLLQKYLGICWLGLVPAVVMLSLLRYDLADFGWQLGDWQRTLLWGLPAGGLLILLNAFAAKRPESLAYYPQVRVSVWTPGLVLHNALAWIGYLVAYEFLFRGLLFYSCLQVMDPWIAIAINVALYSTTHFPKGFTESLVTIPFGIVVCVVTLITGSIWFAVLVHCCVALSNDFFALSYQSNMRVQWQPAGSKD